LDARVRTTIIMNATRGRPFLGVIRRFPGSASPTVVANHSTLAASRSAITDRLRASGNSLCIMNNYSSRTHQQFRFRSTYNRLATIPSKKNPFVILGIPRNSDPTTIRNAFLRLAIQFHPDTSKDEDTKEQFAEIKAAYERIKSNQVETVKGDERPWLTEEFFQVWFAEHTGLRLDGATRRAVMIAYSEGGPCENGHTRTRYLPPEWKIAFILEEEGMLTKQLSNGKNSGPIPPPPKSQSRRRRGF